MTFFQSMQQTLSSYHVTTEKHGSLPVHEVMELQSKTSRFLSLHCIIFIKSNISVANITALNCSPVCKHNNESEYTK